MYISLYGREIRSNSYCEFVSIFKIPKMLFMHVAKINCSEAHFKDITKMGLA